MLEEPKAGPHVFQVQICDHLCVVGHDTQSHKFRILNKLMAIGIRKIHSIYIYPNIHIYISSHTRTNSFWPVCVISFSFPFARRSFQSVWHFYHTRSTHQKVNDDNDKHFKSKHSAACNQIHFPQPGDKYLAYNARPCCCCGANTLINFFHEHLGLELGSPSSCPSNRSNLAYLLGLFAQRVVVLCVCVCETSFHTQEHTLAIAWVTTCSFSPEYVLILYIYLSVSRAARSERCQIERLYKFHRKREWQRYPKQGQSEFQLTAGSFFFGPKAEIVKRKDITRQKQQFQLRQWNCIWHVQLWRWLWLFLSTAPEFSPLPSSWQSGKCKWQDGEVTKFWTNTHAHAERNKQRLGANP